VTLEADLDEALDALEMMVGQYLYVETNDPNDYSHAFMSAGECACEVLAKFRPTEWRLTPTGAVQTPDQTALDEPASESPELNRAMTQAMMRAAQGRAPDPHHFKVLWELNEDTGMERCSTIEWAYSSVHHWLAMGAERLEIRRYD
jgi:hypothetical protein